MPRKSGQRRKAQTRALRKTASLLLGLVAVLALAVIVAHRHIEEWSAARPVPVSTSPDVAPAGVGEPEHRHPRIALRHARPAIMAESGPLPVSTPRPAVAIVIDDLGADIAATRRAIRLPPAVTLSFLPYPDETPALAREAEVAGHQVILHMPMQPEGPDDPGPNALTVDLSREDIIRRVQWALGRVPGLSGVNNHMGSRFTADAAALAPVMATLANRHVFFLDSRTTPDTQAEIVARRFGVPSAGRDIFLDDEQSQGAIEAELAAAELRAREEGVAIAIGHPHAVTLDVLAARLASPHGITLVPLREAIRMKMVHDARSVAQ